jgi:hypothetical protein
MFLAPVAAEKKTIPNAKQSLTALMTENNIMLVIAMSATGTYINVGRQDTTNTKGRNLASGAIHTSPARSQGVGASQELI